MELIIVNSQLCLNGPFCVFPDTCQLKSPEDSPKHECFAWEGNPVAIDVFGLLEPGDFIIVGRPKQGSIYYPVEAIMKNDVFRQRYIVLEEEICKRK